MKIKRSTCVVASLPFRTLQVPYYSFSYHMVILLIAYLFLTLQASARSFYPIFNKRIDHLETLLTICRPKKVL